VIFSAPFVTSAETYEIVAILDGYGQETTNINILNQEEKIGWIYGVVTTENKVIENVEVSVKKGDTNWVDFTDESGKYLIAAAPGVYYFEASKDGYIVFSDEIEIINKNAIGYNIELEENNIQYSSENIYEQLFWKTMNIERENGVIGGKINVEDSLIDVYNSMIDIEIQPQTLQDNDIISFNVDSEESNSQVFIVEIEDEIGEIQVTLDENILSEATDLSEFFSTGNQDSEYIIFEVTGKTFVLVNVGHFSKHNIKITSVINKVVDIVGGPVAVLIYIIISFSITAAFIYPFIIWPRQIRKGKRHP